MGNIEIFVLPTERRKSLKDPIRLDLNHEKTKKICENYDIIEILYNNIDYLKSNVNVEGKAIVYAVKKQNAKEVKNVAVIKEKDDINKNDVQKAEKDIFERKKFLETVINEMEKKDGGMGQ